MRFILLCLVVVFSQATGESGRSDETPVGGDPGVYSEPDFSGLGLTGNELEYLQPGPGHSRLEFLIGRFTSSGGMSADHGQPQQSLRGTIESRWVLGGRYVETRGAYDWNGQPIRTLRYLGFDALTDEYLWIDMDNWRVFPIVKRGALDPATGTLTFTYEYPQIGGPALRILEVIRLKGADSFEIENIQFLPVGGFETRSKTVYRRAAASAEDGGTAG